MATAYLNVGFKLIDAGKPSETIKAELSEAEVGVGETVPEAPDVVVPAVHPQFEVVSVEVTESPRYGRLDSVLYVIVEAVDADTYEDAALAMESIVADSEYEWLHQFIVSSLRIPWLRPGWLTRNESGAVFWHEQKPEYAADIKQWVSGDGVEQLINLESLAKPIKLPAADVDRSIWPVNV